MRYFGVIFTGWKVWGFGAALNCNGGPPMLMLWVGPLCFRIGAY